MPSLFRICFLISWSSNFSNMIFIPFFFPFEFFLIKKASI
ncbi:hypothetical protein LptCag_1467 [Leptospirillum ferriphilum]|uniref:Uncharacterized protein n=1 Tax=Leptospirillum ferriphilum TaxID=178606 RepID=A0A094WDN3_9BACT|nr:hypothetical protein LptCag_1467 [Leptospirillum ferriphilum]